MKGPRRWVEAGRERAFAHHLLSVDRVHVRPSDIPAGGPDDREVLALDSPDWVNVVALTGGASVESAEIVLVRQWRFAAAQPTLEIPGGLVDPGETPLAAARRELREETGFESDLWRLLGSVHPNPAILTNRCHVFLAEAACRSADPSGDGDEEIEVTTRPLLAIPDAISAGEITHSLVIAAFHLLDLARRRDGGSGAGAR
jgi:8-oxo-dGTP pyrophosphatase MutT (NUDIX family)